MDTSEVRATRSLKDLPRIEDYKPGRAASNRGAGPGWDPQPSNRRGFLGRAVGVATAFSLVSVGSLPLGRDAYADHLPDPRRKGYRIWTDGKSGTCDPSHPDYYYGGAYDGCTPGCYPETRIDPAACVTSGHYYGYHKESVVEGDKKWILDPGICMYGNGQNWDGWHWTTASCPGIGCPGGIDWRCHDGRKLYWTNNGGGHWAFQAYKICRFANACA